MLRNRPVEDSLAWLFRVVPRRLLDGGVVLEIAGFLPNVRGNHKLEEEIMRLDKLTTRFQQALAEAQSMVSGIRELGLAAYLDFLGIPSIPFR